MNSISKNGFYREELIEIVCLFNYRVVLFLVIWYFILVAPEDEYDDTDERSKAKLYRNISLQLSTNLDCCAHQQWWVVKENCDDPIANVLLKKVPLNDCRYIMMFLFNDKAFPDELSFISGFGSVFCLFKLHVFDSNTHDFASP